MKKKKEWRWLFKRFGLNNIKEWGEKTKWEKREARNVTI